MHLLPKFATITKNLSAVEKVFRPPIMSENSIHHHHYMVVAGGLRGRSSIRQRKPFSILGCLLCCCFAYTRIKLNLSLFCSINNSLSSSETLFSFVQSPIYQKSNLQVSILPIDFFRCLHCSTRKHPNKHKGSKRLLICLENYEEITCKFVSQRGRLAL